MNFGMTVSRVGDIEMAVWAEKQGYDFCWAFDSPMIRSNIWSLMTLLADRTERIRIGSGVAVPGLRMAPVTANAIATINALAPGRTFLGVGTGNTAMRAMGQRPQRFADFEADIRVIRKLLDGEPVEYVARGKTHTIEFQSLELDWLNLDDRIPIQIGGFGPKAIALAGEIGDGLITSLPRGGTLPEIRANLLRGAERTGRSLEGFESTALVSVLLLRDGETLHSNRPVQEIGSSVMVNLHYLYDLFLETGAEPPAFAQNIWDDYVAFRTERDANRDPSEAHGNHYGTLDPEEARFVTPELIQTFAIAGHPGEVIEQLNDLENQGLTGICFIPPAGREQDLYEEFATQVIAAL
ncbi:MAG: 5,10-methylenetetrahydromethanopterin reductase [Acidimicrobiales bacterium]|jgi:5,10-methylenetetrahydromethanopterin reductase